MTADAGADARHPANFHATGVLVRGKGILISGTSGSGKTRLALELIRQARCFGHPAGLVSDDQVLLSVSGGRLVAEAPPAIFGLVEVRGFGPVPVRAQPACAIDLLVRLVPATEAPRMAAEGAGEMVAGCRVPRLLLPERDAAGACLAIEAFLFGLEL